MARVRLHIHLDGGARRASPAGRAAAAHRVALHHVQLDAGRVDAKRRQPFRVLDVFGADIEGAPAELHQQCVDVDRKFRLLAGQVEIATATREDHLHLGGLDALDRETRRQVLDDDRNASLELADRRARHQQQPEARGRERREQRLGPALQCPAQS